MTLPICLTIAGSDSGGGAGIQADLKTFAALGTYGASVVTALTAQNTLGVQAVHAPPAAFVAAQLASVLGDLDVAAVKVGMLANAEVARAVVDGLAGWDGPLVVDPVMVATSGDPLLDDDAVAVLVELFERASVVTPNVPEAARLGADVPSRVLLKGGHAPGDEVVDVLRVDGRERRFAHPRIDTRHTHGTGCTLSSAIAARLAHGDGLDAAVEAALAYLQAALRGAYAVGRGRGPVHHTWAWAGE